MSTERRFLAFKFPDGYKSTIDWCSVYSTPQVLPKYSYLSPPLIFPTTYNGIRTNNRPVWITPGAAPIRWMGLIRNPRCEQKRTEGYLIVSKWNNVTYLHILILRGRKLPPLLYMQRADPWFCVRGTKVGEGSGDRLRSPAGPGQSSGKGPPEAPGFWVLRKLFRQQFSSNCECDEVY